MLRGQEVGGRVPPDMRNANVDISLCKPDR